MHTDILLTLKGRDLRSVGRVEDIIPLIKDQERFDVLFRGIFSEDRIVAMRAADAAEKITVLHPVYLEPHIKSLLGLLEITTHKELKWHLAQMLPRIRLSGGDCETAFNKLRSWALDTAESRIVRVNALQALHDIAQTAGTYQKEFEQVLLSMSGEAIPAISARIRKLQKDSSFNHHNKKPNT